MASNDEFEHRQRTQNGSNEIVAPGCGERRVCSYLDAEVGDDQIARVIDGKVVIDRAPDCDKESSAGRR